MDDAIIEMTYNERHGTTTSPVPWDLDDASVRAIAQECLRNGDVRGLDQDPHANLDGFVVKKYAAKDEFPNRFLLRPSTEFGRTP